MTRFGVIAADPPWKLKDKLPGDSRGAARNYTVMATPDICRLTLPHVQDSAYLFLWRLASMQADAIAVATAWGFTVKSEIVWLKLTKKGKPWFGMGRHVRASHEVALVCTRGRAKPLSRNERSIFEAPVPTDPDGKYIHSAKPEAFYEKVMRLAGGPYVELFARGKRPNWTCVGAEAPRAMAIPVRPE